MRFQGSKMVHIECLKCRAKSPPLRVYLSKEGEELFFNEKKTNGWEVYEEATLFDDPEAFLDGYCPKCKEEEENAFKDAYR